MMGELKFGNHIGTDTNGNEYYENREYIFGQHRWVEYADIHNYDSSTVTPDWHGWLHHMSDTPPGKLPEPKRFDITTSHDDCPYTTHVGSPTVLPTINQNLTGFRPRGYGFGNLYQKWGEPELYYKQPGHPGHPMSDKGGRFNTDPEVEFTDPNDPSTFKIKESLRSLDKN